MVYLPKQNRIVEMTGIPSFKEREKFPDAIYEMHGPALCK
jgi:hypothetical protein